jgi:hypothetical protein
MLSCLFIVIYVILSSLSERTLHFNSETISLKYYPPAHSDSDISVRFAEADVLRTGDTWFNGTYPFIDYHNGGSWTDSKWGRGWIGPKAFVELIYAGV